MRWDQCRDCFHETARVPHIPRQPGGNVTGVSFLTNELGSKRLELLHELVPAATAIGVLVNPTNPNAQSEMSDLEAAARVLGLHLHVEKASSEREIDAAFTRFGSI